MRFEVPDTPDALAVIKAGIMEAIKSPEFIRALAAEMGPEAIMLTSEQVRALTQLAPSTFDRWLKRYREKLQPSYVLGRKEPRYAYAAVRAVLSGDAPKQGELIVLPTIQADQPKRRASAG